MTARLARTQPAVARVLLQVGLTYVSLGRGLAPRALRDIRRGIDEQRFKVDNPDVALASTAGCVLAFLQLSLDRPATFDEADADALAEMLLRMLGMTPASARTVAHRTLPTVDFG